MSLLPKISLKNIVKKLIKITPPSRIELEKFGQNASSITARLLGADGSFGFKVVFIIP